MYKSVSETLLLVWGMVLKLRYYFNEVSGDVNLLHPGFASILPENIKKPKGFYKGF